MREMIVKERFTPFPVLHTERLILRQLQITDIEEIFTLRTDRTVNRYIRRAPLLDKDEAYAFILKINEGIATNKWIYWAIRFRENPKVVGTICLWNFTPDNCADIGYELLPEFHRQGIMTEAMAEVLHYAKKLKLTRIEANTIASNEPSTQLLTKHKFQLAVEQDDNVEYNEVCYFLELKG